MFFVLQGLGFKITERGGGFACLESCLSNRKPQEKKRQSTEYGFPLQNSALLSGPLFGQGKRVEGVVSAELPVCVSEQIGSTKLEVAWYVDQAKSYRTWGRQVTRSNRQRESRSGADSTRLLFHRKM